MKKWKKALLFALALLPFAALAGYFTVLYQLDFYDAATIESILAQAGSLEVVIFVSVVQVMVYGAVCGFFGYILAEKTGLMKPLWFEKAALMHTVLLSLIGGVVFAMDYWTFGFWIPGVRKGDMAGLTGYAWLSAILYGGILEEVMMRLFMMSLLVWLIWKVFFRKREEAPGGVLIAANWIVALLFAAGHLPMTITMFGTLTPLILLRCFLFNGGFGSLFGWLYRKYGIQYAMLSHGLLHIVSKSIWLIFV